jgi:hypothetical protein
MKRIVFLTCIGSVALALTAWGAPKDRPATRSAKAKSAPSAHTVSARGGTHVARHAAPVRTTRSFSAARSHQRAIATAPRTKSTSATRARALGSSRVEAARIRSARTTHATATAAARNRTSINRERNLARANTLRTNRVEAARLRDAQAANANRRIATRNNLAVNRTRNVSVVNNRARNVRVVNNWRSDRFRNSNYSAFYNYNRRWHDRSWWRRHYTRIIFVSGGWWYWNTGYWYPAWGYDPYAYYPYDGPVYGYGDLTPDQVIINVQAQLQDDGYYAGPVDGILGPQTREALAAFQADHGLAITSAVDRPTLQTLGLA